MTYHWTIPLCAALLNGVLGTIVLLQGWRRPLNRLFCFLSATLVLWNMNIFILYYGGDPKWISYWSTVFRVGTLFAATVAAHLFVAFSETKSRVVWSLLGLGYLLSLFLVLCNGTGHLVEGLHEYDWGFYPVGGPLYWLVPVSVAFDLTLGAGVLVQIIRHDPSPRKRQQAKLWIAGAAIAGPLAMTNLGVPVGIPIYPLGNMANVAYAMFIAYGILRHRLLDFDLILAKSLSYILMMSLLVVPAFLITIELQEQSFGVVNPDFSFALLLLLVITAVLFPGLRQRTELGIERSFFREKHEHRKALRIFTRSVVRILDQDRLTRELCEILASTLNPSGLAVYLRNTAGLDFELKGFCGNAPVNKEFKAESSLVSWLSKFGQAVLRDELDEQCEEKFRGSVTRSFLENNWELCVPLTISGSMVGFLAMGRKVDRDAFSVVDLDLLVTMASQCAVALENARLYAELKKSKDIIQRAGRLSAIGTLAAGIAHEIRNPLVSIQTFFQLAPQRMDDEEFLTTFLALTEGEVQRICDLISELLNFAKSATPSLREHHLEESIQSAITLLLPHATKQSVSLRWEAAADVPMVYVDPDQIKQVLINLILNGIEASAPKGTVTVSLRIIQQDRHDMCQIEVRDSGAGIPADVRDSIFDPFFTTKTKGTGLGLSIAYQIMMEHGGFIAVESDQGAGTRFFINLPLADEARGRMNDLGGEVKLEGVRSNTRLAG